MKRLNRHFLMIGTLATLILSCAPNNKEKTNSPSERKRLAEADKSVSSLLKFNDSKPGDPEPTVSKEMELPGNNSEDLDQKTSLSGLVSSSAAVENTKDSSRKFIRTADLKFRVEDVKNATYKIEDLIAKYDGFVSYTNLLSNVDNRSVIPISADSSLETIYYTVENNMTLRVPNIKLDSTLKDIAKQIDYLDYRVIKANDISLLLFSNKLTQKRLKKHSDRLSEAIDNKGKKLVQIGEAENNLLSADEQSDNNIISTLSMLDQVSYSTIILNIYQRQVVKRELVENDKNIESYQPGFFIQLRDALQSGWSLLQFFVLFLAKIWWILLTGSTFYFLYRKSAHKKK